MAVLQSTGVTTATLRNKTMMQHILPGYGIDSNSPRLSAAIAAFNPRNDFRDAGKSPDNFANWLGRNGFSDLYDNSEMGQFMRRSTQQSCEAAGICLYEWGHIDTPCLDCELE